MYISILQILKLYILAKLEGVRMLNPLFPRYILKIRFRLYNMKYLYFFVNSPLAPL